MDRKVFFVDGRDPAGPDLFTRKVLIFNGNENPANLLSLVVPLPDGERLFIPGMPLEPFTFPAGVDRLLFVVNVIPPNSIFDNRRSATFIGTGTDLMPFYILRCNGPTFTLTAQNEDPSAPPPEPGAPPAPMPKGCGASVLALLGLYRG